MTGSSATSPRALGVLCLASLGWSFSFGLGAPLASLWLQDKGFPDSIIGLSTGVYYLGIALTAFAVPGLMQRLGQNCPLVGMVISGLSVALFPWVGPVGPGFAVRFLNGVGGALSLIPIETYVNRHSPPGQRARNFGFYAFSVALGWALGNLVGLELYPTAPRLAFALGGLAAALAAVVLRAGDGWPACVDEPTRGVMPPALSRNLLSYGSAWAQGFLEGGMVAFLPIYLLFLGLPDARVGWTTSGIMIGVITFQIPVAWLADRLGRAAVLVGCYATSGLALACLPFCGDSAWLVASLFLAGACSGAFYPLGLAILGEALPAASLARASAWYMTINCLGSLSGPIITGTVMDGFGKRAMFPAGGAALLLVLLAWAAVRRYTALRGTRPQTAASAQGVDDRRAA